MAKAKKKKILVVDDEKNARKLLRDILQSPAWEVLEAEDGLKALEIMHEKTIDLLITDRSMPNLGGLELLQKLREEKRFVPAIIVSAFGEERLWAEAIGLGAEEYILKPFQAEEVLRVVQKNLEKSK